MLREMQGNYITINNKSNLNNSLNDFLNNSLKHSMTCKVIKNYIIYFYHDFNTCFHIKYHRLLCYFMLIKVSSVPFI